MDNRYITPQALAEQLRVDEATVRRWAREGRIPGAGRTPGGQLRLPSDSAKQLLRPLTEVQPEVVA